MVHMPVGQEDGVDFLKDVSSIPKKVNARFPGIDKKISSVHRKDGTGKEALGRRQTGPGT